MNDILTKSLGSRLSFIEVAFFRFFFSMLSLLPFILVRGLVAFTTDYLGIQLIRSFLLALAVALWCYGVASLPLALTTTISFTVPLFVLPLAKIFLKEYVGWQRCLAIFFGFIGIIVSLNPSEGRFNHLVFLLMTSTILFAALDIINKKLLIENESLLTMLFYSALGTSILGFIPLLLTWETPTFQELFFLFLLGVGANLILFCLLKAFAATEIIALQPFRYLELIISTFFGFLIFQELPLINTFFGVAIIIPSILYISIYEARQQQKKTTLKELDLKKAA